MTRTFFDSSGLLKHYHAEKGSPAVDAILGEPGGEHLIARVTVTELYSAFAKKVRVGEISDAGMAAVINRFLADVHAGMFKVVAPSQEQFLTAEALIQRYGSSDGLRTLDALQIAAALTIRNLSRLDQVLTSDVRMKSVLSQEGFVVPNPVTNASSRPIHTRARRECRAGVVRDRIANGRVLAVE